MSIFIWKNDQQNGPYSEADILEFVKIGTFSLEDLSWTEGQAEWRPLAQILPNVSTSASQQEQTGVTTAFQYEGIGRLTYVGLMIGIFILTSMMQVGISSKTSGSGVVTLLSLAVMVVPIVFRLQNIGKSVWWSVLIFIPLANIYIGALCLFAPQGYEQSKQLDKPAKIILGIIIGLIVIIGLFGLVNSIHLR